MIYAVGYCHDNEMGWLTGKQIEIEVKRGKIKIDPYYEDQLNPNSYDYRLAPFLRRPD
ncbi:MAG: hypothetical protein AAB548_00950 [Patescibacteria group bacterium]